MGLLDTPEARLGVAVGIGLLLGTDRERQKGEGPTRSAAGVRTFALVALLGGIAQRLGPEWAVAAGAVFVGAAALVSYALGDRTDPGLTSEVALVLAFALGAFAQIEPRVAAAAGIVAGVILAFRNALHDLVRERLTTNELLDALLLATVAIVVLPLAPNHTVDPLGVVNPFRVWRLVLIVMAVGAAGHVAQRMVGARLGLALAGFAGGFVSSAATIAAMGQRAKATASLSAPAAAGAAASTIATFVQMALLVGAASPRLLQHVALPLGAGGIAALLYAGALAWRADGRAGADAKKPPEDHSFKVSSALLFAALVTGVTFASTWIAQKWGEAGVLAASGVAAFADAHASGAAVASVEAAGHIPERLAVIGVLIAISTNTATKIFLAFSQGPRDFAMRVTTGLALVLASVWTAWAVASFAR